jgi:hypothetical protein
VGVVLVELALVGRIKVMLYLADYYPEMLRQVLGHIQAR